MPLRLELTSDAQKEDQHDWVEEAQDEAENVLMNYGRNQEHPQHSCSSCPATQELSEGEEEAEIREINLFSEATRCR